MSEKLHLFVGFGDIASRCAKQLVQRGERVVGVARSPREQQQGLTFIQGDATSDGVLDQIAEQHWDSAVITLSPDRYDAQGYRESYFAISKALLTLWQEKNPPRKIVFVSSTSVYAQSNEEWVDEASEASPKTATAKILRETENLFFDSELNTHIVRFSGIYGPGREYLIRQVQAGNKGRDNYTNRIHVDDCVGVICFLIDSPVGEDLYLASDCEPVKANEIRQWLAEQLKVKLIHEVEGPSLRGGNKRCSNKRLIEAGYRFIYPTYKEGYGRELVSRHEKN